MTTPKKARRDPLSPAAIQKAVQAAFGERFEISPPAWMSHPDQYLAGNIGRTMAARLHRYACGYHLLDGRATWIIQDAGGVRTALRPDEAARSAPFLTRLAGPLELETLAGTFTLTAKVDTRLQAASCIPPSVTP